MRFLTFLYLNNGKKDGKLIGPDEEMLLYQRAIEEIKKECPQFTLKIIVQGLKAHCLEEIEKNIITTIKTAKKFPHLIVGYDLVMVNNKKGVIYENFLKEEDKYKQMIEIAEVLLKKEQIEQEYGHKLPFVFHGNFLNK